MGILEVKNLKLALSGKEILRNISIDFWDGHIHALIGPNGAGKSTLAYTIMGLEGYRDFSGDILFQGMRINSLSVTERAKLGITLGWQEPARFEGVRVKDFILASLEKKNTDIAEEALEQMGLSASKYLYRSVDRTLSGGERKRIELASIIVMKPKLVLLDEPDSGIDIAALEHIFSSLTLLKNSGTTVILITHSLAVLSKAEHAFLICNGTLCDKGPVEKIKAYFEKRCNICADEEF